MIFKGAVNCYSLLKSPVTLKNTKITAGGIKHYNTKYTGIGKLIWKSATHLLGLDYFRNCLYNFGTRLLTWLTTSVIFSLEQEERQECL